MVAYAPRMPSANVVTPLARAAMAWLAGMTVASLVAPFPGDPRPRAQWIALGAGLAALAVAAYGYGSQRGSRSAARSALLLGMALLGGGRHLAALLDISADPLVARADAGPRRVRGVVSLDPDRRDTGVAYRIRVEAIAELEDRGGSNGGGSNGDGSDGGDGHEAPNPWRPADGLVLVHGPRFPVYAYGDRLELEGMLKRPPQLDGFDYRAWLARKGIYVEMRRAHVRRLESRGGSWFGRVLVGFRGHARSALQRSVPAPESALAVGILLGDARGIPRDVDEAFRITNTTHVIAISGSNIALLVVALQLGLGGVFGRRRAAPFVVGGVIAYTAMVGADAAVVRAAIMGTLLVVADVAGRPAHAMTALLAAALGMTVVQPLWLGDLGFQLSFAATAGLIVLAAPMGEAGRQWLADRLGWRPKRAAARFLDEALWVTLAAQLATWPLIAWHTGQLSLAGLAANALIVPVQPAVMGLGALTAFGGTLWAPLGRVFGTLAWLPLAWTIRSVEWVATWPGAAVAWQPSATLVVAWYVALAVGVALATDSGRATATRLFDAARTAAHDMPRWVARLRASRKARRRPSAAFPTALGTLCVLAWSGARHQPDGLMHLDVLDVGQGDALWVETPNGRRMLVDGGPSPSAVLAALGRRKAPWDRRVDVVVLTHPDADHVAGLPAVLARYRVGLVVGPGVAHDTPDGRAWEAAVRTEGEEGAERIRARAGDVIVLDEAAGVRAVVLWPTADVAMLGGASATSRGGGAVGNGAANAIDASTASTASPWSVNDRSVVLRLEYGRRSALLTGDISEVVEERLVASGAELRSDVLKVPHHGSDSSSSPAFLARIRPRVALIGVGADNRFDHPRPIVLERLASLADGPASVRRTDQDGELRMTTDGRDWWLRDR